MEICIKIRKLILFRVVFIKKNLEDNIKGSVIIFQLFKYDTRSLIAFSRFHDALKIQLLYITLYNKNNKL